MSCKKIFNQWGKFTAFTIGMVIIPILTAIPIANEYGYNPTQIYLYFGLFYVISFIAIGIPIWLRYSIQKEIYKILKKENIFGEKNVK